jgi:hypothetical protein
MPEEKKEGQDEVLDKETKEIVKEIEEDPGVSETDKGETSKSKEEAGEEPEKKPDKKEEEAGEKGKDEDEGKEGDEGEKTFKRTPKLMPLWKHNVAEKHWGKEKEELESKLQEALKVKDSPEKTEKIKEIAEKFGLDAEMVSEIVGLSQSATPKDVLSRLEKLEKTSETTTEQQQDVEFERDFSKNVLPLIKDEYPEASDKLVGRIKTLIESLAFTEELIGTPLSMIYKGSEQFRGVKGKKSAESSTGSGRIEKVGIEGVTPEDIENMSDAEFDKFSDAAAKGTTKFKVESKK